MKKKIDVKLILIVYIILVLIGKLLRYTLLKESLVDAGVGHYMIYDIVNQLSVFKITFTEGVNTVAGNSTIFFQYINIFGLTTYIQFEIFISVIWNLIILWLIIRYSDKLISSFSAIFLSISVIVMNIWNFCLSKEPLQFLFFLLMFYIIINSKYSDKKKKILCQMVILLIAILLRNYYILMSGFLIIIFYFFPKIFNGKRKILLNYLLLLFLAGAVYYIILIISKQILPAVHEELLYIRYREALANTEIISIFNLNSIFSYTMEYILVIVRLLFPVELIMQGIKFIPYVIYQLFVTFILFSSINNYNSISSYKKMSIYVYLAFLFTSATFEPDFGSWVRHEAVLLPIILIMANIFTTRKKTETANL